MVCCSTHIFPLENIYRYECSKDQRIHLLEQNMAITDGVCQHFYMNMTLANLHTTKTKFEPKLVVSFKKLYCTEYIILHTENMVFQR